MTTKLFLPVPTTASGNRGPPYEDWQILLQIDSFSGMDFNLNFMDFGVLDFLISPEALRHADFSDVRAIVLST